jgi:CBS domain-containing protein
MSVGQYCNREVIVTSQDSSILEVAQLMRQHHVGNVIVIERQGEQNIPVGIATDRDLVVEILAEAVSPDTVTVGDIMSPIVTISEKQELWGTLKYMRNRGIRRMPVVNETGGLEGIITIDDILALLAEGLTDLTQLVKHEIEQETRSRNKP